MVQVYEVMPLKILKLIIPHLLVAFLYFVPDDHPHIILQGNAAFDLHFIDFNQLLNKQQIDIERVALQS